MFDLDADPSRSYLLLAMAAHVVWTLLLYVLLTLARAPAVWGVGTTRDGSNPWRAVEPRISANLSNQFEWPLFFHVAGVLLLLGVPDPMPAVYSALAWVFVGGRVMHSAVQILTTDVRLRGIVFTLNFVAVLAMWAAMVRG